MMKLAVDFDNTLIDLKHTSLYPKSKCLALMLISFLTIISPPTIGAKKFSALSKKLRFNVYIVSSRPKQLYFVTKLWCILHRINHNKIFLCGSTNKKIEFLNKYGFDILIDDKKYFADKLENIKFIYFNKSWDEIIKDLESGL